MRPRPQDQDTICALITPYGVGGVSMIRVSGSWAIQTIQKLCSFFPKKPTSHQAYFGVLEHKGESIDEVVVLYFKKGKSFTSDETIEICCHGSPVICEEILNALQDLGCRMAEKGEFTYRAFLSGRIDLAQAEGVLSVIEAGSLSAKKQGLRYLQGEFSHHIEELQKEAEEILTHVEAGIDFSEENLKLFSSKEMLEKISGLDKKVFSLVQNYKQGLQVRKGLRVGLFGPPNSGKSTLFNSLLDKERAIVSDQKGTTRDQLTEDFFLKGQKVCLIDTAGVHPSKDMVEKKGLEKTYQTLEHSDLCLFILDINDPISELKEMFLLEKKEKDICSKFYESLKKRKESFPEEVLFIFNKTDQVSKDEFLSSLKENNSDLYEIIKKERALFMSASKKQGLDQLKNIFTKKLQSGQGAISLPRHYQLLNNTHESLKKSLDLIKSQEEIPLELVAFEIRQAVKNIQSLLGKDVSFDVLGDIFKNFCIGK